MTKNAGKACNNRLYRHIRTFEKIIKNYFVIYRKRDYQIDVLVSDIEKARRKYPKIIIDHTTIDEIMLLLVKGEN